MGVCIGNPSGPSTQGGGGPMAGQACESRKEKPPHDTSPPVPVVEGVIADLDRHSDTEQARKPCCGRDVGTGGTP